MTKAEGERPEFGGCGKFDVRLINFLVITVYSRTFIFGFANFRVVSFTPQRELSVTTSCGCGCDHGRRNGDGAPWGGDQTIYDTREHTLAPSRSKGCD